VLASVFYGQVAVILTRYCGFHLILDVIVDRPLIPQVPGLSSVQMNGQTPVHVEVPLPGGGLIDYPSGYYAHRDWNGAIRLVTTLDARVVCAAGIFSVWSILFQVF
jgi:hypothetical protein